MDKNDYKIMKAAIKHGDILEISKILAERPNLINEITPFGSWLQVAATEGKYDVAKYLIDIGIDVNESSDIIGSCAIKDAAYEGFLDIVELLYEHGAILDISTATKNPLLAAIPDGHFDVVKYLVEKGIDIKATYEIGDIKECDAYEYARQYGQTEIANYLKSLL